MKRALIVDDNAEGLYLLRAVLEGHGWVVDSARQGAEALVRAREALPDLVVSDLLMPVMDGYTLLRAWKADEQLSKVPFVVYTATYIEPEDERLARRLGADAFILKPAEPDLLIARLTEVESKPGAPEPGAKPTEESALLQEHGETLIRKLEQKMSALEQANRALKADIAMRESTEKRLREETLEHQKTADQLRMSEGLLRVAGRVARLGGWTVDLPDLAVHWSDEVCAIHEVPPGTVPSIEQAIDSYAPEFRETIRDHFDACVREGTPFDLELQVITSQKRRVWVRAVGEAIRGADGQISRVQGAFQDVDERKRLGEQLRQAQKMEAIGQLAGGVAHDFNNLLSVILSYSMYVVEQLRPGDPLRADIEEVQRAGERATELTRQLLAFSRQQILQPRILDVNQVLLGMERMLRRLLGEDIELSFFTHRAVGKVHVDPTQIEQIVMNLVVNARDAMPGGGKLTIETGDVEFDAAYAASHHGAESGAYVMLAITDSGQGMDAATSEHIFEPFFTTKDKAKGTGLGLSTVLGIVKQSGGHIWVYSEPGRGTTFKVYFPRSTQAEERVTNIPPAAIKVRGSETVLLVEDEEQVRAEFVNARETAVTRIL